MTPDGQLMQDIRAKYGRYMVDAVKNTLFPESLLAALVANESGLNENASRFEPGILADLTLVLVGRKAAYGSIGAEDLKGYFPNSLLPDQYARSLMNLAMSWGPTQILGYQALAGGYSIAELNNVGKHFVHAVQILAAFQKAFNLEPASNEGTGASADPYFRCWNSGAPKGRTFDPQYAAKGLARMAIYNSLEVSTEAT
jgi:hypothetical protein